MSRYGIDKLSEEDRAILSASGKAVDPAPPKDKKTKTETHERGEYPDLSEYPELHIVKAWADSVMVPPECAEKWHAEQVAAQWLNRNSPSTVQRLRDWLEVIPAARTKRQTAPLRF